MAIQLKKKTDQEKAYHGLLALMPCMLCEKLGQEQRTRTEVHHISAAAGMGQRSGHNLALPLCSECHRGNQGVHGDKSRLRMASTSELKLLDELIGLLVAMKLENVGTEYAHTTA